MTVTGARLRSQAMPIGGSSRVCRWSVDHALRSALAGISRRITRVGSLWFQRADEHQIPRQRWHFDLRFASTRRQIGSPQPSRQVGPSSMIRGRRRSPCRRTRTARGCRRDLSVRKSGWHACRPRVTGSQAEVGDGGQVAAQLLVVAWPEGGRELVFGVAGGGVAGVGGRGRAGAPVDSL